MGINEEFCGYLKSKNFKEFMELWKEKYEKYGRCGGTISVPLNDDNRDCIELLMGKNYHKQSHAKISYQSLKKSLDQTKFQDVDFNDVLLLYFNDEVIYRRSQNQLKQEEFDKFYTKIFKYSNTEYSKNWLNYIYQTNDTTIQRIKSNYFESKSNTLNSLKDVITLIDNLPRFNNSYDNLTIFVSKYTKDPHSLDKGKLSNLLFYKALSFIFNDKEYTKNELLEEARLYIDLTNNYISVFNMIAMYNGKIHEGWKSFYLNREMMNFNIDNLYHIDIIDNKYTSKIFILENPSIFQSLSRIISDNKISNIGLVCTYGQLNQAAYLLMNIINKSNIKTYYSGDFDPEGLLIAQKILDRYPNFELWHYDINDYLASKSNIAVSKRRIKSLENLNDDKLKMIGECIETYEKAGYQENIINDYIKDIIKISSL